MPPALVRLLERLANAFPLGVAAACGLALVAPAALSWFRGPLIVAGLAVIMLGMGMTLSLADFTRAASRPLAVVAGVAGQFLIMPAAGCLIATGVGLPTPFAVGLILSPAGPMARAEAGTAKRGERPPGWDWRPSCPGPRGREKTCRRDG